jgi:hypothetical protein
MSPNRRNIVGLLGAGAAGVTLIRVAQSQAPPPSPDADVQAARQSLQRDAQRVDMVKLPQTTEPAVHFRA